MDIETLKIISDFLSSYVSHNNVASDDLPGLVSKTINAFLGSTNPDEKESTEYYPSTIISTSVTNDYIVCLEDGKKLKTLTRYLRVNYNLSPDEYRKKWNLPNSYPMIAPSYAEMRSAIAKQSKLGHNK